MHGLTILFAVSDYITCMSDIYIYDIYIYMRIYQYTK